MSKNSKRIDRIIRNLLYTTKKVTSKDFISYDTSYPALQVDLIELRAIDEGYRGPFKYILMCIEIKSRKIYAGLMTRKTARETGAVMRDIIPRVQADDPDNLIHNLTTDDGKEFLGEFDLLVKEANWKRRISPSKMFTRTSLSMVERANQTFMNIFLPSLYDMKKPEVTPEKIIEKFVLALTEYNEKVHSATGCSPDGVIDGTCTPKNNRDDSDYEHIDIGSLVVRAIPLTKYTDFPKRMMRYYPSPYVIDDIDDNGYYILTEILTGETHEASDKIKGVPKYELKAITEDIAEELLRRLPRNSEALMDQLSKLSSRVQKEYVRKGLRDDRHEDIEIIEETNQDIEGTIKHMQKIAMSGELDKVERKQAGRPPGAKNKGNRTEKEMEGGGIDVYHENNLINFDNYLPKERFKNISDDIPKFPFRMGLFGSSGSGKTNLLCNILHSRVYYDNLFLFYKNQNELKYQFMIDFIHKINEVRAELRRRTGKSEPRDITLIVGHSIEEVLPIEVFENEMRHLWMNPDGSLRQTVIVFDDMLNEDKGLQRSVVGNWFIYGRKLAVSSIYISQSYHNTDALVRANLSSIFHARCKRRDNITLHTSLGGHLDKKTWDEYVNKAWEQPFGFIQIDLNAPQSKMYKIGLTDKCIEL